jgi:FlaA1/EpsC-like NDP-sugar epimerase
VDDDPRKIGRRMNGIPVWGPIAKLSVFLEDKAIDEIVITTSHLSAESKRAITEVCGNSQIRLRRATLESTTAADYAP